MTRVRADVLPIFSVSKNFVDLSPVAVTDVETVATFPRQMKNILIYNNGANDCYFSTSPGVVAGQKFIIPNGFGLSLAFPITSLYFIAGAGLTCTLFILGED